MNYKVVDEPERSELRRRSFSIDLCLEEGFGNKHVSHSIDEVKEACIEWMKIWVTTGRKLFLVIEARTQTIHIFFSEGELDGMRVELKGAQINGTFEPPGAWDDEESSLNSLASYLGEKFGQVGVSIEYHDRAWALQDLEMVGVKSGN